MLGFRGTHQVMERLSALLGRPIGIRETVPDLICEAIDHVKSLEARIAELEAKQ